MYGETGRFPLQLNRKIRILKYWFKVLYSDNILLKYSYNILKNQCNGKKLNWVIQVKQLLEKYGFNYVWINPFSINCNEFLSLFKQRIHDVYITEWRSLLFKSSRLYMYKEIKMEFSLEFYLKEIKDKAYRNVLSQFRCVSHNLAIETGRHGPVNVERSRRLCKYCNLQDIEDEYHFLLICPLYRELRSKYIDSYYWKSPSMYKCISLLKMEKLSVLKNVAQYLLNAFELRKSTCYN